MYVSQSVFLIQSINRTLNKQLWIHFIDFRGHHMRPHDACTSHTWSTQIFTSILSRSLRLWHEQKLWPIKKKRSINALCVVCFILESVWNVWVWTSDMRGAGTDANVYLTLYGDKGKTDEVPIGNATDNFEQGQLDKFKVSFLWLAFVILSVIMNC